MEQFPGCRPFEGNPLHPLRDEPGDSSRMPPSLTLGRAGLGLLLMYANAIGERNLTRILTGGKYEGYAHTPQRRINLSLDTRAQYLLQSLFSPSKAATL